jgi:hypothetical protein
MHGMRETNMEDALALLKDAFEEHGLSLLDFKRRELKELLLGFGMAKTSNCKRALKILQSLRPFLSDDL